MTTPPRRTALQALAATLLGLSAGPARATAGAPAAAAPIVAAAADLKFALQEAADAHERAGGSPLRLVFGSSGIFRTQLLQGAPYELFLSADEELVFELAAAGRTLDRGRLYAEGRIVLLVPNGSPLKADGELADLAAALRDGRLRRFAIANPEHAPYGRRAEEALRHAGLWEAIRPHLLLGENVAQAAQFVLSGSAQGGIVAQSVALAPALASQGSAAPIPASWHRPLRQRMVLLKGATPAAHAFHDWLGEPAAQRILARYGFTVPASR